MSNSEFLKVEAGAADILFVPQATAGTERWATHGRVGWLKVRALSCGLAALGKEDSGAGLPEAWGQCIEGCCPAGKLGAARVVTVGDVRTLALCNHSIGKEDKRP